jgi:hypothetical protein
MQALHASQLSAFVTDPGFEIGWDHAHHRLVPPAEQLLPGNPVRDGWEAGQAVFGSRTLRATPQVRKWLQLRLGAWMRGKAFESVQVTPNFLARIEVPVCPITGLALTQATGTDSDASVDRVNNAAGYAAGNLAILSVRANKAKSGHDWRDAAGFVRQIEAGGLGQIDGLSARDWARLAALMSYCTPLTHDEAARLPMLVLPPPRLRLLNPVQAVQAMLTLAFAQPGQAPRLGAMTATFPAEVHLEVRLFLGTLLARRIGAGPAAPAARLRSVMEAAWTDPLVIRRWRGLALRLDAAACEVIAEELCAAVSPLMRVRHLALAQATEGWALETGGLRADQARDATLPGTVRPAVAPAARRKVYGEILGQRALFDESRLSI